MCRVVIKGLILAWLSLFAYQYAVDHISEIVLTFTHNQ